VIPAEAQGQARCEVSVLELARELVDQFTSLWWEGDASFPDMGRTYSHKEHVARERELRELVGKLLLELEAPPETPVEREQAQTRAGEAGRHFARFALDLENSHLDMLIQGGFSREARTFSRLAREFDPQISTADVLQANRNVWTMNGIQRMLGLPIEVTPSVFAYSLLYPYTDNYLDDPLISEETKVSFNERIGRRLRGEAVAPANAQEERMWDLIGRIESQYDRSSHPQVFESLLAIQQAQEQSVRLLRRGASPYEVDVLGISLKKGGASVLADGYLVAGSPSRPHAELFFGLGALLQLADDLQDVKEDRKGALLTIFSQTAQRWSLDGLTNRTFSFRTKVMDYLRAITVPDAQPLADLMRKSSLHLIMDSASQARHLYSRRYIRDLEIHSPFRFSVLQRERHRLERQRVKFLRLMDGDLGKD